MKALGMMSGTSCDGVDCVLVDIADVNTPAPIDILGHHHVPFAVELADQLRAPEDLTVGEISALHFRLPEIYAEAARGLSGWEQAEVCGAHGQTLWHAPPSRGDAVASTFQIGSSAVLAARLGLPVVSDFRGADIALGGEGAPISSYAHWFCSPREELPHLVVNFGGIANITWVTEAPEQVLAYDVGPAMMLSDAWARIASSGTLDCDRDGVLSAGGAVVQPLLAEILRHPFLAKKPPKTTGREDFGEAFSQRLGRIVKGEGVKDVAFTLLVATSEILRNAIDADRALDGEPRRVTLTGGGAKNPVLVELVSQAFPDSRVVVPEDGPFAPSHHEPMAMALLAARTFRGLPSVLPRVTGASRAAILGHVHAPPPQGR